MRLNSQLTWGNSYIKTTSRRAGRIIGWIIIIVLVLAVAGMIYQAIATAIDEHRYPPPGKLVDVGGYRLHINCTGEGSPTVIL